MRLIRRFETVILTSVMLASPVLGAVALHELSDFGWLTIDWSDPLAWVARTPPEDIAAAILRHVGLIGCYWLSTASVVYTAGRLAGLSRIVSALVPVTPRIVRSVADRLVIGAVTLSSLGISPAPAMADRHQPPMIPDPIEIRATVGESDVDRAAVALVRDDYLPYGARSSAPAIEATRHPETVEVRNGDSLWLIAKRHLTTGLNRPPTQEELRSHWLATIAANLPTLSSGNPDLIHPGEIITLPPVQER